MKKFKVFFYPFYLIIAFLVLYYSIDILANMDAYKEKVDFSTLRKLPEYLLYLLLIVSVLMITEIISENVHILNLKKKVKKAEEEVLKLKARIYDRSVEEDDLEDTDSDEEEIEEDDGEEDDYKIRI